MIEGFSKMNVARTALFHQTNVLPQPDVPPMPLWRDPSLSTIDRGAVLQEDTPFSMNFYGLLAKRFGTISSWIRQMYFPRNIS